MKRILVTVLAAGFVASVALGDEAAARNYKMKCKMCHGADGKGLDEAAALKRKLDPTKLSLEPMINATREDSIKVVTEGKEKMPKYGEKMTAEEIAAVTDYSLALVKGEVAAGDAGAADAPAE